MPLNPFELDVYDAISAKGIELLPQWGVSRYRIDLVACTRRAQVGSFSLSSVMARVTTRYLRRVTVTGYVSNTSRRWVGSFTGSGQPIGSCDGRKR